MDTSNPGPLIMLGGGIVMFLGSILKWGGDSSGGSTDAFGLLGILALLFGAAIAATGGIKAFAPQVSLPDQVLGFRVGQVTVILALSIFLWTFGLISAGGIKFGLHLTWIGAAIAAAGGIINMRNDSATTGI